MHKNQKFSSVRETGFKKFIRIYGIDNVIGESYTSFI